MIPFIYILCIFYVYSFIYHYFEEQSTSPRPAMFFIHGGGLVSGTANYTTQLCDYFAKTINIVVINANYRVAPEHVFPAAINDLYNSLKWVYLNHGIAF